MTKRKFLIGLSSFFGAMAFYNYPLNSLKNKPFIVETSLVLSDKSLHMPSVFHENIFKSSEYLNYKKVINEAEKLSLLIKRDVKFIPGEKIIITDIWRSEKDYYNYFKLSQVQLFASYLEQSSIKREDRLIV